MAALPEMQWEELLAPRWGELGVEVGVGRRPE